ncbi:endonuclease III [Desulfonatronovibrio magnus]|uniref:endonuclease III n=1 Tax=Desulfonatronovibrio magnus TaxID=698827 RepID=UPI0005EB4A5C|nr:endonuclease III [Desulfonatronovibrio magnus]
MNINTRAEVVLNRLKTRYPVLKTALNWENPWQLLIATVLSAQCTDKQVNKITPELFRKWPEPVDLAHAPLDQVAEVIRSAGFYRNKSKNIIASAKIIVSKFEGKVPSSMEDLLVLPGVARKTANIVLSGAFGLNEGIAVDTHVKRIAFRLGFTSSSNPVIIEKELMNIFVRQDWANLNHMLVFFGREVCTARKPGCAVCELSDICPRKGL